jgi:2,4'-dihydroxyacetophenone dioxygenase
VSRHIHPSWVTGYVIKGAWRYLEHDWVATDGSFVYEPPGEIHTLVVDEVVGESEMITQLNIHGAMVYVDDKGQTTGYEDVFTKIEMCRKHYIAIGLGAGYIDQFIR